MHPVSTARSRPHQAQSAARTVIGTLVHKNNQFLLQGDDATPGLWPVREYAEHLGGLNTGDRVMAILQDDESCVVTSRLVPPAGPQNKLVVDAPQGVVLKAGDALLELRADGTVLINGKNIYSEASGLNQISGARLNLN